MSGSTAQLRNLLARLDAYVTETTADGTPLPPPTTSEAMATYEVAARLVESDLRRGRAGGDLSMHRDVLTATQRMLQAALEAHGEEPSGRPSAPVLRLVEGCAARPS